ncbi:hypothetical protein ES044_03440 [Polaribacter sp. IC066]|nr:hypothetical protein ES043_11880 [Polaribacter sp. IC063]TXD61785.1 hypothetical protein ES044_03440 [Polaribacter sp. IC066]
MIEVYSQLGKALFVSEGYVTKANSKIYEPATYIDQEDPPLFLWQGGMDEQIIPETYTSFIPMLRKNKDVHVFVSDGEHSPTETEFKNAYITIFHFLDAL